MPRQFVIADIHGCCRTFRHLIFNRLKLTREDSLVLLGDYIDRGPDSKGVLDTIIELNKSGYTVIPILGNHEDMLLNAVDANGMDEWLDNGGRNTLDSYGVNHPSELPVDHLEFMRNLPEVYVTDFHVFVHAGLNFWLVDPLKETKRQFKLWSRLGHSVDQDKIGGRKLVVGHTICTLDEIRKSLKRNRIRLDNGCCLGTQFEGRGNLLALELESGELYIQENME